MAFKRSTVRSCSAPPNNQSRLRPAFHIALMVAMVKGPNTYDCDSYIRGFESLWPPQLKTGS
ncbi:protein of unknown function [Trichlorobacter ammonificans]|uniref:Uncharacterized protein n=1 Tax=Trichlorobacter ammonificans TaxID=2916410 RepID=A0ABM9D7R5_9BACT|nr:protein of unknown function [Trichlorobacter ammonificans]